MSSVEGRFVMQAVAVEGYELPEAYGFSAAVRSGGLVFFSGMVGADLATLEVPGEYQDEVTLLFENLARVAQAAGTGLDRLVRMESQHCPLTAEAVDVFRRTRAAFIATRPAWTASGVVGLAVPFARVEVTAVAEAGA